MRAIDQLLACFHDYNALQKASSLMAWDQQVLMPTGGVAARSAHLAILGRMAHETLLREETLRLLETAAQEAAPGSDEAMVRAFQREVDMRRALPADLVERKSRVSSDAYKAWRQAREENNFGLLAPYLTELFEIARETAERRGYTAHIYDPLIDLFEEGATHAQAAQLFSELKGPIIDLIREIKDQGPVDDEFLSGDWNQSDLRQWAETTTKAIGFNLERGRLDITSNAFCMNLSNCDVRMTTRPSSSIKGILFSSLHEMGHGLYEQCSPPEWDRSPLAGGISMAVHESQSRFWENVVGRSEAFWQHFYPSLQQALPGLRADRSAFYRAINRIEPGPIRIGSDELSYNLHILVRFELECDILEGRVKAAELPDAWNSKYAEYLGVHPANDSEGCLQDVHWSRGSVGYFPTYSMGNLISWQVWDALRNDVKDVDDQMAAGRFAPVLDWLTERIYRQGKRYRPNDLVMRVTGNPMGTESYLRNMRTKYVR